MAKINPYKNNLIATGVGGGDQAIRVYDLTTNITKVVLPNAAGTEIPGGPTWKDVEHVVGQLCDGTCRLVEVNVNDFSVNKLVEDGVNRCCAGGSKWSAQCLHGTYINSVLDSEIEPIVYGSDGTLAYTNHAHQGLWLRNADGSPDDYLSTAVVDLENVCVLGSHQAFWLESGKIKCSWSLNVLNLPGAFGWVRAARLDTLYVMYHHFDTNKVLLHPWNSLQGWVLGDGLCYYPDIQYDDINLVCAYSHVANDSGLVTVVNPQSKSSIDLRTLLIQVPPDPEPPVFIPAPNKIETVRRMMRLHPEINCLDESQRGKIVDYVINAENTPPSNRPWGRKARNSDGSNKNTDGLTYLNSDGSFQIIDIIAGSDPGGSNPDRFATWDNTGQDWKQGENGYWAPGEPVSGTPPVPVPTPDPDLEVRVTKLEKQVLALQLELSSIKSDSLKSGDNITLQSNSGLFVCAESGGSDLESADISVKKPGNVNATRKSPGGWETFKVTKS